MRRAFNRPIRRALAGNVPPLLRRANRLMAAGDFAAAADAERHVVQRRERTVAPGEVSNAEERNGRFRTGRASRKAGLCSSQD